MFSFIFFLIIIGVLPVNDVAAKSITKETYTIHNKTEDAKTKKEAEKHTAVDKNGNHISLEEQNREGTAKEKSICSDVHGNGITEIYGKKFGILITPTKKSKEESKALSWFLGTVNLGGCKNNKKARKTVAYDYLTKKLGKDLSNEYGYKTFDDLLNAIYGNSKEKKLAALLFKGQENTYYDKKRKLYFPSPTLLQQAAKYEMDGLLNSVGSIVDIDDSESIAIGSDIYAEDDGVTQTATYEEEAGDLEKALTSLLICCGDSINNLIGKCDTSLDKIIFGRIIYHGTNYFCFELIKGNPYGILGIFIYNIFRSIAIPILILMGLWQITKAGWTIRTGEQRSLFKDVIEKSILVIFLLFFIPFLLDVMIYLKDIFLYEVSKNMSDEVKTLFSVSSSDSNSIIYIYRDIASNGNHFFDGLLYLAVSFVLLFYFITYISTAISVMICFMFFSLVSIFSINDNKLLDSWLKEMLGNIFAPILDAVLLLIPVLLKTLIVGNNTLQYFIILIACYAVIPSRALIRCKLLGVGGSTASEMLGLGAMFGAMRMLGGIKNRAIGGAKDLVGSVKQAREHQNKGKMYDDLARANGEVDDDQLNGLGVVNNNPRGLEELSSTRDDNENDDEYKVKRADAAMDKPDSAADDNIDADTDVNNPVAEGGELSALSSAANNENELDENGLSEQQRAIDMNNVLKEHATTDNFENPEFSNAFNFSERAKLHKQKAKRTLVHGAARAVGSTAGGIVGGAVGGAVLGGATMMAGPGINTMATTAGVNLGSEVGSFVGGNVNEKVVANLGMYAGRKMDPNYAFSHKLNYNPATTQARPTTLGNYVPRPQTQVQTQVYNNATDYSSSNNSTTAQQAEAISNFVQGLSQETGYSQESLSRYMDILGTGKGEGYDEIMEYYDDSKQNPSIVIAEERKRAEAFVNMMQKQGKFGLDTDKKNDLMDQITMILKNQKGK